MENENTNSSSDMLLESTEQHHQEKRQEQRGDGRDGFSGDAGTPDNNSSAASGAMLAMVREMIRYRRGKRREPAIVRTTISHDFSTSYQYGYKLSTEDRMYPVDDCSVVRCYAYSTPLSSMTLSLPRSEAFPSTAHCSFCALLLRLFSFNIRSTECNGMYVLSQCSIGDQLQRSSFL